METLEKRVQVLEDIEAIKRMKAKYGYACDDRKWEECVSYFIDELTVTFRAGTYKTKKDLLRHFTDIQAPTREMSRHWFFCPVIEVNGNTGRGIWYFNVAVTEKGRAMWTAGRYDDEYVKENGEWKHKKMICTFSYDVPYEVGWGTVHKA